VSELQLEKFLVWGSPFEEVRILIFEIIANESLEDWNGVFMRAAKLLGLVPAV